MPATSRRRARRRTPGRPAHRRAPSPNLTTLEKRLLDVVDDMLAEAGRLDMPWDAIAAAHIDSITAVMADQMVASAKAMLTDIDADPRLVRKADGDLIIGFDDSFGTIDRLQAEAAEQSGELITNMTDRHRETIRREIARTYVRNPDGTVDTTAALARRIHDRLAVDFPNGGLTAVQAQAVENAQTRQLRQYLKRGISAEEAESKLASWRATEIERHRKYRARNIARTEVMTSANTGRRAGVDEAVQQGLIDPRSMRRWSAEGNPPTCPICLNVHGTLAPLQGSWPIGEPPAHASCRCTWVVVPADDTAEAAKRPPALSRPGDTLPRQTHVPAAAEAGARQGINPDQFSKSMSSSFPSLSKAQLRNMADDLSPQSRESMADTFEQLTKRHPHTASRIDNVGTVSHEVYEARFGVGLPLDDTFGWAGAGDSAGRGSILKINSRPIDRHGLQNWRINEDIYRPEGDIPWFVGEGKYKFGKGAGWRDDPVSFTTVHEFSHHRGYTAFDELAAQWADDTGYALNTWDEVSDLATTWLDDQISLAVETGALPMPTSGATLAPGTGRPIVSFADFAEDISPYAKTNLHEFTAESLTAVHMYGDDAPAVARWWASKIDELEQVAAARGTGRTVTGRVAAARHSARNFARRARPDPPKFAAVDAKGKVLAVADTPQALQRKVVDKLQIKKPPDIVDWDDIADDMPLHGWMTKEDRALIRQLRDGAPPKPPSVVSAVETPKAPNVARIERDINLSPRLVKLRKEIGPDANYGKVLEGIAGLAEDVPLHEIDDFIAGFRGFLDEYHQRWMGKELLFDERSTSRIGTHTIKRLRQRQFLAAKPTPPAAPFQPVIDIGDEILATANGEIVGVLHGSNKSFVASLVEEIYEDDLIRVSLKEVEDRGLVWASKDKWITHGGGGNTRPRTRGGRCRPNPDPPSHPASGRSSTSTSGSSASSPTSRPASSSPIGPTPLCRPRSPNQPACDGHQATSVASPTAASPNPPRNVPRSYPSRCRRNDFSATAPTSLRRSSSRPKPDSP